MENSTQSISRLAQSLGILVCSLMTMAADAQELSFNRDVRPILSDACFFCHGPDPAHREAGLRLDVEEDAKELAIVPGKVEQSELVARITSDDEELLMPPPASGKRLTQQQQEILKRWIAAGAKYEPYWAYVPPQPHRPPAVQPQDWATDPIDQFVLAAMRRAGFSPAPDADPATLIRRLSFDLTGMPPSPEVVAAFVKHPSRTHYVKIVDRLLASPAFGERMASYWLDLVRGADTVGYHGDQDHNSSPYRDYVIEAFNDNMPLDQFTREQLAGDLLPDPTTDQLIATAYNRLLQTSHEGGVQPQEYLAIYAADRIRNLSAVWMGATVGCAQCHDHKYDPYTTGDFYSLVAFFADVDEAQHFSKGSNSLPTRRPPEIPVLSRWQRRVLESLDQQLKNLPAAEAGPGQLSDEAADRRASLQAERERIKKSERLCMITQAVPPREIRILPRGDWLDDSGPVVQPAVPAFLKPLKGSPSGANRLDLANWLVDAQQGVGGLTSRVFVNRFWYLAFGRGISSSLEDFGGQGQPPTHPELLDQLSLDFIADRWNVKRLMRRLVLTRTYRQSSVASPQVFHQDPYNLWFARQSRFRMPAEMVRDNALVVAGLMVNQVGGASVKPYQPSGYYRHLNFPRRVYAPHTDARQWRRGVYVHWQRQFLHPMLKAMDAPSREECTARRARSNTPLEALVLLNDPTMVESAMAMAARLLGSPSSTTREKLQDAFRWATSRSPTDQELQPLKKLLEEDQAYYQTHPDQADRLIESANGLPQLESFPPVQLATWTSVCRAILNLHETVNRN